MTRCEILECACFGQHGRIKRRDGCPGGATSVGRRGRRSVGTDEVRGNRPIKPARRSPSIWCNQTKNALCKRQDALYVESFDSSRAHGATPGVPQRQQRADDHHAGGTAGGHRAARANRRQRSATQELHSQLLPRYARRTREIDEAILGYLGGVNSRRIRTALKPLSASGTSPRARCRGSWPV